MTWVFHTLPSVVAVAVALSGSIATAHAGSEKACWRTVLADWASGGIDRGHSVPCYQAALHNLPNDIRTYTTAEDDIRRALLDEIRSLQPSRESRSMTGREAAGTNATNITSTQTRVLQGRVPATRSSTTATTAAASAPPLRAIVAAALALLLVLLAGIGKIAVHRRAPRAAR